MKAAWLILLLLTGGTAMAQDASTKLKTAMSKMEADPQFAHALISLYIVDAKSGEAVYNKNEQVGLAPASCQKVITSATAFEILGKDFTYKTSLYTSGKINGKTLNGKILVLPFGDPTFGSWRYGRTKEDDILKTFSAAIFSKGIKQITGGISVIEDNWQSSIPDGWIWQDIGNYYGAAAGGFNWRENQYDLVVKPGKKIGDPVVIMKTIPTLFDINFKNEMKTAATGNGELAYIYLPVAGTESLVNGPIGLNKINLAISGSIPDPGKQFSKTLWKMIDPKADLQKYSAGGTATMNTDAEKIAEHSSPSLDSIIYWFMKKSINLYGEALVKTIAFKTSGYGSTVDGVEIIRKFWEKNGIEKSALNIMDGSGLSPGNRVTTAAMVKILSYAKTKTWFPYFYDALPIYNDIRMKSGHINDVLSYSGYVTDKQGKEYTFSFIINNYDGSTGAVKEKMFKILDLLK